jgi:hypothetical protein
VRLENRGTIVDAARQGQAVYLITAAVRKNGAIPPHELVQAAKLGNDLIAGTESEVISIAKDNFYPRLAQLNWRQSLDRTLSADRHEDGSFDCPVRRLKTPSAGRAIPVQDLKVECHSK